MPTLYPSSCKEPGQKNLFTGVTEQNFWQALSSSRTVIHSIEMGVWASVATVSTTYTLYGNAHQNKVFLVVILIMGRSQWSRRLRRGSAAARLLGLRVWIPPGSWMSVCCECCVLLGRVLCVGLITRPEESYWVWSRSLGNEEALMCRGCCAMVCVCVCVCMYIYGAEWRKLHNEELSDLYSLPSIVRVVKSRRMRWAGHVARRG
jgi:hypothetical protein